MGTHKMKFGSLFAGIGGIDLGLERAGMKCIWQVEINSFCCKVLAKHWPKVRRFEDVRECGEYNLKPVDLIAGGFPCQDVSIAGNRRGLEGERTTLWSEFARIIGEIKPKWVLAENVPGLLSSDDGRFFGEVLRDLAESGYDAEWDCIPAAALGTPHRRDRVYIVAYSNGGNDSCRENKKGKVFQGSWRAEFSRISWWASEPRVCRVVDGVSSRMDKRNKALGNAVVPEIIELIGKRILSIENA
jgi:DNA (cytosine-5)-methyltransferase 1